MNTAEARIEVFVYIVGAGAEFVGEGEEQRIFSSKGRHA